MLCVSFVAVVRANSTIPRSGNARKGRNWMVMPRWNLSLPHELIIADVIQGSVVVFSFARMGSVAAAFHPAATAEQLSDEMLVEQIACGKQLAMRTLFARHRLRIYRFVLRMVRDEALAEDILSEVFLDVWRKADQFEARAAVSTWLLAIARFKALSAMRRRVDVELDNEMAAVLADPADNPEVTLQHKNNAEILRQGLGKLSPAHSEVIDLVYYHGKSVKEVAEIVGISEATVKTRMFYGRKKLADLVHEAVSATLHWS